MFAGHTVFENLELALAGKRSVWHALFGKLSADDRATIDHTLETIGLTESRIATRVVSFLTVRSSGWRSACFWRKSRGFCW